LAILLKFSFGRFDGPRLSECEGDETVKIPRSERAASAFEAENAQDGPEALVEITRRLLHVATSILVLLSVYTFYVSSPVLIPLTLAVLITMLLAPVMSLLDGLKLPRPLSAALVMAMMVGIVGGGAYGLSGPAQEWLRELSQSGGKIDKMLRSIKQPFVQIEKATDEISSARQKAGAPQRVQMATPSLTERLVGGTAQIAAAASVILVLVFFLLSAGDTFLRKLVSVIPTLKDNKRTVEIIRSVESDISFYLVMMLLINIGLGVGVAIITAFLGMDPLL
jgi:predicted PurR-regulated permease PerM